MWQHDSTCPCPPMLAASSANVPRVPTLLAVPQKKRFPRQTAAFMVDGASISSEPLLVLHARPVHGHSQGRAGADPHTQSTTPCGRRPIMLARAGAASLSTGPFTLPPTVGACLGTPPLTVYVESASGIREGARTGIATLMVSCCCARFGVWRHHRRVRRVSARGTCR